MFSLKRILIYLTIAVGIGASPLFSTEFIEDHQTSSPKIRTNKKDITYEWITRESYLKSEVQNLLENFISQETMGKVINLSLMDGRTYYHECVTACLVAEYRGKVVGFLTYEDYFDGIKRIPDNNSSDNIKKLSSFYYELDDPFIKRFSPIKKREFFYLTSAHVENNYRSNGIMTELVKEAEKQAMKLGYKFVLLEPSGREMQHILTQKLNYEIINELKYKDFKYEDQYPFSSIEKTPSCLIVMKNLIGKAKI